MAKQQSHTAPMQTGQRNILAAAATGITDFILETGGNAEAVCSLTGVDPMCLHDPRAAMDLGAFVAMFENAAKQTNCDNFGLIFGNSFRPEQLGLIGEIAVASPTLGSAVQNLAKYFPFHQQATETQIGEDSGLLTLEYRILDGSIINRRQDAELTMGMFVNVFRHVMGDDWAPEQVWFEHPCPADCHEHRDIYQADVCFSQRTNAVVFRNVHMDQQMPKGDLAKLDQLCRDLMALSGGTGSPTLLDSVKGEIRSRLAVSLVNVECVAEALGMARWTLQRRLSEYGLSFSDVVEVVRKELAAVYLAQTHVSLSDISFCLGYSEQSAFTRAFQRWYGVSPRDIRKDTA